MIYNDYKYLTWIYLMLFVLHLLILLYILSLCFLMLCLRHLYFELLFCHLISTTFVHLYRSLQRLLLLHLFRIFQHNYLCLELWYLLIVFQLLVYRLLILFCHLHKKNPELYYNSGYSLLWMYENYKYHCHCLLILLFSYAF